MASSKQRRILYGCLTCWNDIQTGIANQVAKLDEHEITIWILLASDPTQVDMYLPLPNTAQTDRAKVVALLILALDNAAPTLSTDLKHRL